MKIKIFIRWSATSRWDNFNQLSRPFSPEPEDLYNDKTDPRNWSGVRLGFLYSRSPALLRRSSRSSGAWISGSRAARFTYLSYLQSWDRYPSYLLLPSSARAATIVAELFFYRFSNPHPRFTVLPLSLFPSSGDCVSISYLFPHSRSRRSSHSSSSSSSSFSFSSSSRAPTIRRGNPIPPFLRTAHWLQMRVDFTSST